MSKFLLRFRPDGGGTGGAPAPAAVIPMNDASGDAPIDRVIPQEHDTPASVSDASRAFRERIEKAALEADTAAATGVVPVADAPADGQPRNADGTFAPKDGVAPVDPAAPDAPIDPNAPPVDGEAKVFVLKGESQRGETDIELDVTGLPPEVLERLERSEKQGMKRAEYNTAMQKVRTERADLDAVETEIRVDPAGFVLNRVAPADRAHVAETLLLEQWDHLAPLIEQLWTDDAGRMRSLGERQRAIGDRRNDVVATVQASRDAANVRAAVSEMIPDNVQDDEASQFFTTAIALLQNKAVSGERITPADVPTLLAAHRRRFFGAADVPATTPPARPKLAVRTTPSQTPAPAAPKSSPSPVLTQADVTRQIQARNAALAVAPQGAGAAAVQRPGGPPGETVEQASRRLRGQAAR